MKYLSLLSLIVVMSCYGSDRKFKVGDCVQFVDNERESWQRTEYLIKRITQLGKRSYRYQFWYDGRWENANWNRLWFSEEHDYEITTCPDKG